MDQDDHEEIEQWVPAVELPAELYSLETGEAFQKCLITGRPLLDDATPYVIQKTYRQDEVIMEMAVSLEASREMGKALSEQSRDRIQEHIWETIDFEKRYEDLVLESDAPNYSNCTKHCAFNGKIASDCSERTVVAMCIGKRLLYLPNSPMMLSDECLAYIQSLMSETTRRTLDDFVNQHFPTPPEMKDLPRGPVLFG